MRISQRIINSKASRSGSHALCTFAGGAVHHAFTVVPQEQHFVEVHACAPRFATDVAGLQ